MSDADGYAFQDSSRGGNPANLPPRLELAVAALAFTAEYLARWRLSGSWLYPLRPMAVIDLLAILPFYLSHFVDLRSLRLVRLLRAARLLKLYRYSDAAETLGRSFLRIRHELGVIGAALALVCWCGALAIHEAEREAQPEAFARLSDSLWFVLATVTTVGYGDKVPVTAAGRLLAALVMLSGLTLYGTFISLVGGSFVEEIRRNRTAPQEQLPE